MKSIKIFVYIFTLSFVTIHAQNNSLSLSQAIETALENNYGIIISKFESDISSIQNNWGNAGGLPSIDFSAGGYAYSELNTDLIEINTRLTGGIGVRWIFFNGFKAINTKQKLGNLEKLAQGNSAVVIENTIEDVILAYFNVLLQQEKLKVLEKVKNLSDDRYTYERKKQELGSSVTYDVLLAKNEFLTDKAAYLNQEVKTRNSLRFLSYIMSTESFKSYELTEKFIPDTTNYLLNDLVNKMQSSNQVLQNQYLNLLIKKNEIRINQSALYPSASLSLRMDGAYSFDKDFQGTNPSVEPNGNIQLSYNIYSGGIRKQAVAVAKINQEIAETDNEEIKHSLTNQLLNEYDLYNVRKELLIVANENLAATELNLTIADEKFKTGVINSFNYRDIQLNYLNSALMRLEAIYNLIQSKTTLTRLIGGFIGEK